MNTRQKKTLLWLAGVGFLVASTVVCAVGLKPVELPAATNKNSTVKNLKTTANNKPKQALSLAEYEPVWTRSLRRKEVKQVTTVQQTPKNTAPAVSPPKITLLGTMIENGNSFAIIEAKRGQQELLGVGDVLNFEIQVLSIEQDKIQVMYHGKKFFFEAPQNDDDRM